MTYLIIVAVGYEVPTLKVAEECKKNLEFDKDTFVKILEKVK